MKCKTIFAVMAALTMSMAMTGCSGQSDTVSTTAVTTVAVTESVADSAETSESTEMIITWETISPEEIDPAIYKMTGGLWYYTGVEEEKSIDMDGLKGLTTYTPEAIPEYEGYLQYLGENPDGLHTFDVLDMSGRQFMTLTFVSEEQFYVDDDKNEYYVKWDY